MVVPHYRCQACCCKSVARAIAPQHEAEAALNFILIPHMSSKKVAMGCCTRMSVSKDDGCSFASTSWLWAIAHLLAVYGRPSMVISDLARMRGGNSALRSLPESTFRRVVLPLPTGPSTQVQVPGKALQNRWNGELIQKTVNCWRFCGAARKNQSVEAQRWVRRFDSLLAIDMRWNIVAPSTAAMLTSQTPASKALCPDPAGLVLR